MQDCKYKKEQKIVSYNGGEDWQNVMPEEFRKGDLMEAASPDCETIEVMYRWRVLDGIYICEDNAKYKSEIMDESYDGGSTWYASYPTQYRKGNYVGYDADYCEYKGQGHYDIAPYGDGNCPNGQLWDGTRCRPRVEVIDPMKNTKCGESNTILTREDTAYRVVTGYTSQLRSFSIGSCVTAIGYGAFSGNTSLTSCTVESGSQMTTIGDYAFYNCSGLTSFNIPSGVTSIGNSAFSGCRSFTSIDIPKSVTSIGNNTFGLCTGLTSVNISSGVRTIGNGAFSYCDSLTSIDIPDSVTSIGDNAFICYQVTAITVNAPIPPTLGDGAFSVAHGCKIYVPCSSRSTYQAASGWSDYASIIYGIPPCEMYYKIVTTNVSGNTHSIECNSSSILTKAEVYDVGFSNAYSAVIGSCVTEIAASAFTGTYEKKVTGVTIPNSVTSIGGSAFYSCNLTYVTIPYSVTSIGYQAFRYCTGLTRVTIMTDEPPTLGNYAFDNTNNCPIYVPYDAVNKFKSQWSRYASRIQAID